MISISGPGSLGEGGGSCRNFRSYLRRTPFGVGGGVVDGRNVFRYLQVKINQIPSIPRDFFTFPGDLEITRHFWRLMEIPGDLAGLLTHSKNVTTSIHWRKKTFTKSLGGAMAPVAPLATPLSLMQTSLYCQYFRFANK